MITTKPQLTFVARALMFFTSAVFMTGCSSFVSNIQSNIEDRAISDDIKFYVSKASAIKACVLQAGGDCPDLKTPVVNEDALAKASELGYKSAQLKTLLTARPITKDTIQGGRDALRKNRSVSVDEKSKAPQISEAHVAAAKLAADVLMNPTQGKLEELYHQVAGNRDPTPNAPLTLSRREVAIYAKGIQEATSLQGWEPLRYHLHGEVADLKTQLEGLKTRGGGTTDVRAKVVALGSTIDHITLIEAYIAAYFENGNFISVDINASHLEASATVELKEKLHVPDAVAKEMVTKLVMQLMGTNPDNGLYHLLIKASDGGFVTRGGTKYVFPGLAVSVDPSSDTLVKISKIDFTQVGSDVVRAFIEALGDQLGQLPADTTSTACKAKTAGKLDGCDNLRCYVEAKEQVKAEQFSKINEYANQAESLAATATGQVIRGVSWLSLNNESLAKLIETAVGVVARKATEKVTWCLYACTTKTKRIDASDTVRAITIAVGK